jgi:hypothetical protein
MGIRAILAFMGFPQPPTVCYVDTESGIKALNKRVPTNSTKHFDVRFFRILQGIDTQEIDLRWVDTEVADIMTKPLCRVKHKRLMDAILNAQTPVPVSVSLSLPTVCTSRSRRIGCRQAGRQARQAAGRR